MDVKKVATRVLLAFVLVSIGYALGKEVTIRSVRAKEVVATVSATSPTAAADAQSVVVYYLHGTIRCKTCNRIEQTARAVVDREFAEEVRSGRMAWRTDNYQENEALGKRYDVSTSSVVLVALQGDREIKHARLDDVWTHAADVAALDTYLHDSIVAFRKAGNTP